MRPLETTALLASFERRGPGTDAERRAARKLAQELFRAGHKVRTESFWCRPNWALAQAWHGLLAVAGSLLGALGEISATSAVKSFYNHLPNETLRNQPDPRHSH